MTVKRSILFVCVLSVLSLFTSLTGCGTEGTTAQQPGLVLTTSNPKQLNFAWDGFFGTSLYDIMYSDDGVETLSLFQNASNCTGSTHSLEVPVHLLNWGSAQFSVTAHNEANTVRAPYQPVTLPQNLSSEAIGYFKASNPGDGDYFGRSCGMSADCTTIFCTTREEDSNARGINGDEGNDGADRSGAAYVFVKTNNGWQQQAYIKSSNSEGDDQFGFSAAMSADGNTLVVGAMGEDSAATGVNGNEGNGASDSGAAYVFVRNGTTWMQQAYLKASNTDSGDSFGRYVDISGDGNTIAVSAREDSAATIINGIQTDNSAIRSGAVYVFIRSGTTWTQQAYIKARNAQAEDTFGCSVSLSHDGNYLLTGAYGEDSNATGVNGDENSNFAADSGAAYVFHRSGTTWTQQAYLKASNPDIRDNFGVSAAMSADGTTIVVGAMAEDSAATGVNGDQSDNSLTSSGAIYVFRRSGTTWAQEAYIKTSNPDLQDAFPTAMALSFDGNILVASSYSEESAATGVNGNQGDNSLDRAGAAYVFTRRGTTWRQMSYLKASNAEELDRFGSSVAISPDGNHVLIGARGEDGGSTGFGGDQSDNSVNDSGALYLY